MLIKVIDLVKFGFDDEIIEGLVKYGVFPQVVKKGKTLYVSKEEVQYIINTFLKNAIKLYETAEMAEEMKTKLAKEQGK